ncbi:hypothetical protein E2C01_012452 [Portunus trituberculatus]|uniref:Uncharacterized protein n=1 Tax=Portunus trituberculatus TaxID=210409 RepID=A0A5B7DE94_PORTR|nr:hypothetical protein [Portunus trituberculatus]
MLRLVATVLNPRMGGADYSVPPSTPTFPHVRLAVYFFTLNKLLQMCFPGLPLFICFFLW